MAATKDQRKLLNRCVMNEIPVFVLTGTDRCAMAALRLGMQCIAGFQRLPAPRT